MSVISYSVFGRIKFNIILCHYFVVRRSWRLINEMMAVLKEELEDKLNEEALAEGECGPVTACESFNIGYGMSRLHL